MENSYLNFIGYENQDFFPKIEMGLEECPSYSSMRDDVHGEFSIESEAHNLFMASQKPLNLIHNIFEAAFNPALSSFEKPKKHLPFKIIRQEKAEKKEENSTSDETSVSIPIPDKIADKSRRIIKREKAKQRNSIKAANNSAPAMIIPEISQKYTPEVLNQEGLDDKSKKKMVQMIRNRISAQNSRDRKKAYMKKLENQQKKLATDNLQYQKEIRQLKQANEALKLECEQLRRCLMSTISETHDRVCEESASDFDYKGDIELGGDLKSGSLLRKTSSPNHLIKYSLALATLFAVLMFSNISFQSGNTAPGISQLGQQLNTFESKIEEAFSTYRRKLEEDASDFPDMLDDTEMKIEVETDQPSLSDNLKNNYDGADLKKLQSMFHEDYMTKFMNQLKVNASDDFEVKTSVSFPEYVKQSFAEQKDLDSHAPFGVTRENHSALFCPSGFAIQTEKERSSNFSVKLEDGFQSDSKTKLKKSEWLQLIVPKSNLMPANFEGQDKLKISSDQGCESEDSSLVELWCKIVDVRTLQAGF